YPARLVGNMSADHVRLESRVFSRIAPDESMFGFSTTASSEFDYKNDLRPLKQKFAPAEMAGKRQWLDDFLYIEASKDLLRLQRASSEKERMRILERLLYCPNINYRSLLSSKIGKPLLSDDASDLLELSPGTASKKPAVSLSENENKLLA